MPPKEKLEKSFVSILDIIVKTLPSLLILFVLSSISIFWLAINDGDIHFNVLFSGFGTILIIALSIFFWSFYLLILENNKLRIENATLRLENNNLIEKTKKNEQRIDELEKQIEKLIYGRKK